MYILHLFVSNCHCLVDRLPACLLPKPSGKRKNYSVKAQQGVAFTLLQASLQFQQFVVFALDVGCRRLCSISAALMDVVGAVSRHILTDATIICK